MVITQSKALIVDDILINREILTEILEDDFDTLEAENGKQALDLIDRYGDELAIVLLDLLMPVADGFTVLEELHRRDCLNRIPVLVISGEASPASERHCLDLGAADFIHKPFDDAIVRQRVMNIVDLYRYKNTLEAKVAEQTDTLVQQNQALQAQAKRLAESNFQIMDLLGSVVESRNLESGDHIRRVKGYTRVLAEALRTYYPEFGLSEHDIEVMVPASALHDVGKIAIPDSILLKPGKLTPEEFECMKTHTTKGCAILESIAGLWDEEYKKVSCDICRYHHERYDGKGYPDALKGDAIPISAQIVAVADVYDALISKRVYKDAYTKSMAYDMIIHGECGVFSDKILDCFTRVREDFEALSE